MNTYAKFCPNVFIAKCTERHEKGEVIQVTTRHGKENDSIVFNLIGSKDGHFFYSIVRADGFNVQEWAKRKAARLEAAAEKAMGKSDEYYAKSRKDSEFLSLGEPVKVGHHSERRHRKIIQQAWDNSDKFVEFRRKAKELEERAKDWADRTDTINLSMPESLEFYEFKYQEALMRHEGLKNGTIKREHSYSLTYAKKEVNETEKKLKLAQRLWA